MTYEFDSYDEAAGYQQHLRKQGMNAVLNHRVDLDLNKTWEVVVKPVPSIQEAYLRGYKTGYSDAKKNLEISISTYEFDRLREKANEYDFPINEVVEWLISEYLDEFPGGN